MLNIFIVPSTIQPLYGVVSYEDRFTQTMDTVNSIKDRVKNDFKIVLADSSAKKLSADKIDLIQKSVDVFLDFSDDETCQAFNKHWLKSQGENYLLYNAISIMKQSHDLYNTEGRMYKLGGRCKLLENFNIQDHTNLKDKYVFKKRLDTWRTLEQQKVHNSTHLLETRLYSWPFSFADDYLNIIKKNFDLFNDGLDTEHAHFINVPKTHLHEYDKLNVGCIIAASGQYIED